MPARTQPRNVFVEPAAVTILMALPAEGSKISHDIPDHMWEGFVDRLEAIKGFTLKELDGPLINGLIAATFSLGFSVDQRIEVAGLMRHCTKVFDDFLYPNPYFTSDGALLVNRILYHQIDLESVLNKYHLFQGVENKLDYAQDILEFANIKRCPVCGLWQGGKSVSECDHPQTGYS